MEDTLFAVLDIALLTTGLIAIVGIAIMCIACVVYPAYVVVYNIIELCRSLKEGQQ